MRANVLIAVGREDEARAEVERALAVTGNTRILLLHASTEIERLGFSDLAERAFEIGCRLFLESGHEPELLSSFYTLSIHYGYARRTVREYVKAGDLDRAARVLERVWRLAPQCESVTLAFAGMAGEFEKAGRGEDAAKWRGRAEYAAPALIYGRIGGYADLAGHGANFTLAVYWAFYLYLAFLTVRCFPFQRREMRRLGGVGAALRTRAGWRALLFPPCISRLELVSLVALVLAAWIGGAVAGRGFAALSGAAALDLDSAGGNWGSPSSIMSWQRRAKTPEGEECYALSLVHAGRPDEARAILRRMRTPEAANNLGVILKLKGREEDAARTFRRALTGAPDLPEALYKLGREASSVRVDRARKHLPGRPLLAMPSLRTYSRAMASLREGSWNPLHFLDLYRIQLILAGPKSVWQEIGKTLAVISAPMMLLVGLISLVLIFFFPKEVRPEEYGAGWWFGLALPGSQSILAPAGVFVLAAFAYCGLVQHYQSTGMEFGMPGATNPVESIGISPHGFGVTGSLLDTWRGGLVAATGVLVYLIPILSAGGMLAARRFGKARAEREKPALWWALSRAGLLLAGGVLVAALLPGAVFKVPGAILGAAGVASAAVALVEHGRAGSIQRS